MGHPYATETHAKAPRPAVRHGLPPCALAGLLAPPGPSCGLLAPAWPPRSRCVLGVMAGARGVQHVSHGQFPTRFVCVLGAMGGGLDSQAARPPHSQKRPVWCVFSAGPRTFVRTPSRGLLRPPACTLRLPAPTGAATQRGTDNLTHAPCDFPEQQAGVGLSGHPTPPTQNPRCT